MHLLGSFPKKLPTVWFGVAGRLAEGLENLTDVD